MTRPTTLLQIGVALWLIASATVALSQTPLPHRMVDSGFPAEGTAPIAWVDDHRLLFTGVELGVKPQHRGQRSYRGVKIAAYLWDTQKNTVKKFKDFPLGHLCTAKDYVSYRVVESWKEKRVAIYAGKFGSESKLRLPKKYWFNRMSCRYFAKPPVWAQRMRAGRWIQPLLDEHGFIDYGPVDMSKSAPDEFPHGPPVFWSADGKNSKKIDIEPKYLENRPLHFTYAPFLNQYLSRAATVNSSSLVPVFFLSPDGGLRKVDPPKGPWDGRQYFAVKPGILLISGLGARFSEPGDAGIFLLSHGKMTKLVSGIFRQVRVSQNGCRAAFIYAWSLQDESNGYHAWKRGEVANTVRMIDVCKDERRQ